MTNSKRNMISFTAVGSILGGIGLGGFFAALAFLMSQINFGHQPEPSPAVQSLQVFVAYSAAGSILVGVVFAAVQGICLLVTQNTDAGKHANSTLAVLDGLLLGLAGLLWSLFLVSPSFSNGMQYVMHGVSAAVSAAVVYGAWRLFCWIGAERTAENSAFASKLGTLSAFATLVPFVWALVVSFI